MYQISSLRPHCNVNGCTPSSCSSGRSSAHAVTCRPSSHVCSAARTPPAAAATPSQPTKRSARKPPAITRKQPSQPAEPSPTQFRPDGPAADIAVSLKQLQHTASNLDTEPTVDGLLTAFQQLILIQKLLQEQSRQCKLKLFRGQQRGSVPQKVAGTAAKGAVAGKTKTAARDGARAAAAAQQAQAQLTVLNQLRASADDAQDFLLGVTQQLLQDQPPSACSQLLTSSAFRKLNVECLNRLAVNTFVDKQADASPQDMAGLMAALALVRCCSSSSNQVAGFERSQLSSLFSGIMSHLLAHVSTAMQQQQQLLLQGTATAGDGRRRRQAGKDPSSSPAAAAAASAAGADAQTYCQQVAAALAAHVSARVPFNSNLAPHVLHLLREEAPKWIHTITDVESAPSISHLAALIAHPSRYDYAYLAAALDRLATLSEQQQQQQQQQQDTSAADIQQQRRLTRLLLGRLGQLQADATAAELSTVLTAATKLGVQDGRFLSSATALAVSPDVLAAASGGYLANVMYAVAYCSSTSRTEPVGFSKQQQQGVLQQCLQKLVQLIQEQQEQQQWRPGAAAAAAIAGPASTDAAAALVVQPSNVVMALWAASSAGMEPSGQLQLSVIFEYLNQPPVLQQLTSSSSSGPSSHEVARACGTVTWAAAQLGFTGDLAVLQPYAAAFLQATQLTPVACSSSLTVVLSLASLIHQQQQQQQGAQTAGEDLQYWQACFLQTSEAVVASLQQQQQQQGQQHAAAVASQLLWAYDVAGLTPPDQQLQALAELTGDQAPTALLLRPTWLQSLAAADTVADLLQQLQTPAAAVALSDISIAAAAFTRLVELQQQQQQQQQQQEGSQQGTAAAAADNKALVRQCCSTIAQHLTPALQAQFPDAAAAAAAAADGNTMDTSAAATAAVAGQSSATTAAAAATVIWCSSELHYKDNALVVACLRLFAYNMDSAYAADAAAVVAALSVAGRAVSSIYSSSILHDVIAACTEKLLPPLAEATLAEHATAGTGAAAGAAPATAAGAAPAAAAAAAAGAQQGHQLSDIAASGTAGVADGSAAGAAAAAAPSEPQPVLLAQKLLQLHATLGLQPTAEQTYQLLLLVGEESGLITLRPSAAAAAVASSLAAVAELSLLPGWNGISVGSSSSSSSSSTAVAAGGAAEAQNTNARAAASDPRVASSSARSRKQQRQQQQQQLQFPWAWQNQQQQLLQELWQQLLLDALLPRATNTSPKQLVTALEAAVVLAGQGIQQSAAAAAVNTTVSAAAGAGPEVALDIGLAKDFVRAVLDALAPQSFGEDSVHDTGLSSSRNSSSSSLLAAWRPGDWKGEHFAAVAAAATQLDVSCQQLFTAVEACVLPAQPQQQQQQQGQQEHRKRVKARVTNMQVQHVIIICCAAAALGCRVEGLLSHAVSEALSTVEQQQRQQQGDAVSKKNGQGAKQGPGKPRKQQGGKAAVVSELLLLLAWAVAVTDVPQLAQQAQQLAAAAVAQLRGQTVTATAAAAAAAAPADPTAAEQGWLSDVLAARLAQVHVWLSDIQGSMAVSRDDSSSSSSNSVPAAAGLSGVLSPAELQATLAAWVRLQQSSSTYSRPVAAALERLLMSEQQQSSSSGSSRAPPTPKQHVTTADGMLVADVQAVMQGVSVAVVILDDAEELLLQTVTSTAGGSAAAAAERLAADWAPAIAGSRPSSSSSSQPPQQQQQSVGRAPADSSSSSSSSERMLAALKKQRIGDVMWRAKALATRGHWVEVISSREWVLLEGRLDAQVEYLRERLWPLMAQQHGLEGFAELQGFEGGVGQVHVEAEPHMV